MAEQISIFDFLRGHASATPEAPALMFEDRIIGFGELIEQVDRMMGMLCREGVAPGAAVGISVGDEALHLTAALALMSLGVAHVGLPAHETDAALLEVAQRLELSAILRDRPTGWAHGIRAIDLSFPMLGSSPSGANLARRVLGDETAVYVKTSGSTSVPKLFGVSYGRALEASVSYAAEPLERRVMRTSSTDFDSSRNYRIHALLGGTPTVFAPRDMRRIGSLCARFDVTQIHIGTYRLASLLADGGKIDPLPPTTTILTGGSRVPGSLRVQIADTLTKNLLVSYATSEVGRISTAQPHEHSAYPEGIGYPQAGVAVEILDDNGDEAPPGDTGTIRIKKSRAPRSYIGQAADVESQLRDGWFYPNDLVSQAEGGPLIYHGRADDVMMLNGMKISSAAIEDALTALPGVREAVAFPIVSRLHGEIPAVAVIASDASIHLVGSTLLAHCRRMLGVHSPRRIIVVDAIPRTHTGKPIKHLLADL